MKCTINFITYSRLQNSNYMHSHHAVAWPARAAWRDAAWARACTCFDETAGRGSSLSNTWCYYNHIHTYIHLTLDKLQIAMQRKLPIKYNHILSSWKRKIVGFELIEQLNAYIHTYIHTHTQRSIILKRLNYINTEVKYYVGTVVHIIHIYTYIHTYIPFLIGWTGLWKVSVKPFRLSAPPEIVWVAACDEEVLAGASAGR